MAESWPLTFPARSLALYMQKNTSRFQSPLTRTIQTLDRPGRRWVAEMVIRVVGHANGQALDALLARGDSFLLHDMGRPKPLNGVITGVQLVGAHLRGNTSIAVDGLPASQTWLKAGDYAGIGSKLYMLNEDVLADGAGAGTLELNRGLLADAADNAAVNFDRPTVEMLLKDDDQSARTIDAARTYEYSLSFFEAL